MSKEEFMRELEYLLSDIPEEEKKDALDYYRDYLEEAGDKAEKAIIEFGSPERIAAIIRSDIRGDLEDGGAFTERGYEDERFRDPNYQVAKRHDLPEAGWEADRGKPGQDEAGSKENWSCGENQGNRYQAGGHEQQSRKNFEEAQGQSDWKCGESAGNQGSRERQERPLGSGEQGKLLKIILLAVLILTALPAILGIGGGILGLVAGIFGVFVALLVVMGVLTFTLLVAGAALCVAGVIAMFSNLLNGLFCFGTGLIVLSLGFISLVLSAWFYGKLVPWLIRGCINGVNHLIHRKEFRV